MTENNRWEPMRPELKVYIAAKLEHAEKLSRLNKDGFHIISRWIDTAPIHTAAGKMKPVTHWQQENFVDIEVSDAVILYVEPADKLKGALFEIGYAVAHGKQVWIAGDGHGVEVNGIRVPHKDILPWAHYAQAIHISMSLDDAFIAIKRRLQPNRVMNALGELIISP